MNDAGESDQLPALIPLTPQHLDAAARVHLEAFPGFFLSSLGAGVLREFYRAHVLSPAAHCVVAVGSSGDVVGVVAGTSSPDSFYREMFKRNPVRLSMAVGASLVRRPKAVHRMLDGLLHGTPVPWTVDGHALLSSICVAPSARTNGTGRRLMLAWLHQVAQTGQADAAYLTTDAVGNDAVVRWYAKNGWTKLGKFARQDGRELACFQRPLTASPEA